ncbi:glycosyltransferase family 4 protein [Halorientalis litorea]|uniref:glycosyltransferase family 4 protein n=1 Tax=Halorientalis litorea TaxID=2931977 RepID=UPI001FF437E1|nr:glycosyltransferase family 4 protein [Halorientalis litorea]
MKIAFVYDAVYPYEKGGAQKRIWELARRLASNHEVHLYGMHYWDGPARVVREGVTLHGVCEPKELYVDGRRSIPQAIYFAAHLVPSLFREDFDIIDCQEFPYFPCFVSKSHELFRDSTLVITWYEVWDDYWYDYLGKKGIFGQIIERATMKLADTVIPISEYIEADIHDLGRSEGLSVVENGVDYDRLQSVSEAATEWDVIYVGRLSEHKNVDLLLNAIAQASGRVDTELSCCIIGDGPERESLEEYAAEVGVTNHVEFLGFVESDDEVIANIKSASVFILPSIREGFPNTILEANACGVPSIVVDHEENGSTAVVKDGVTGYITDVSAEGITDCLVDCITDEELLSDLSQAAKEFGRKHDWDVIVDELERVYSSALQAEQ